jgi:hypothetical protein
VSQSRSAFARALARHVGNRLAHDFGGVFRVLQQHRDDLIDTNRIMMRMPAIVIGDHGNRNVTKFRLASELGFLQIGHANYVHPQTAVDIGFGLGRELRALHAQIGSTFLAQHANFLASRHDNVDQLRADGISEGNVRDQAAAEKGIDAMSRAVEKLIRNDEIERLVPFLERSHGGDGNDALHSKLLEAMDIGTEVQFARENAVAASMTREKCNFAAFEHATNVGIRWRPEWGSYANFFRLRQSGHGIEPAAADNSEFRLWQTPSRSREGVQVKIEIIQDGNSYPVEQIGWLRGRELQFER